MKLYLELRLLRLCAVQPPHHFYSVGGVQYDTSAASHLVRLRLERSIPTETMPVIHPSHINILACLCVQFCCQLRSAVQLASSLTLFRWTLHSVCQNRKRSRHLELLGQGACQCSASILAFSFSMTSILSLASMRQNHRSRHLKYLHGGRACAEVGFGRATQWCSAVCSYAKATTLQLQRLANGKVKAAQGTFLRFISCPAGAAVVVPLLTWH